MARSHQFNLRLSEAERRRFEALAEHHGISVAELVRRLIAQEFASVVGGAK